jgi:hypothetical protein
MNCSVCSSPQLAQVNALLESGTSIREVARVTSIPRSTLGRHDQHRAPTSAGIALIPVTVGPTERADPLGESFALAERARTPRERIRGLEAVRAATKLVLRGRTDLAQEDRGLLAANVEDALAAYKAAPDFETAARALSGWREAIAQRLDATDDDEPFEVAYPNLTFGDGSRPMPGWLQNEFTDGMVTEDNPRPGTYTLPAGRYWAGVPQRYRDRTQFVVSRRITLSLAGAVPEEIRVFDAECVLVWTNNATGSG